MSKKVYRALGADQAKAGEVVYFHRTLGDYVPDKVHKTEDGVVTHTLPGGQSIVYQPTERIFLRRD